MKPQHLFITVDSSAVKQTLDPRHKRVYASVNAAVFTFNQIEHRLNKLYDLLREYDQKRNADGSKLEAGQVNLDMGYERGNEIVGLAWDLVDWLDRLRKIMGAISGVKKNESWYRAIMSALKHVEAIRHLFQHFDANLTVFIKGDFPLMGSVIAAFPAEGGVYARVLISTPARYAGDQRIHIAGFRVPSSVEGSVDGVTLSVGDVYVDLSDVSQRLSKAKVMFAAYLNKHYGFTWPDP